MLTTNLAVDVTHSSYQGVITIIQVIVAHYNGTGSLEI